MSDKSEIDGVTAAFFRAFTNTNGKAPPVETLHEVFVPGARIVKAVGGTPEAYDVAGFIAPRRAILTDGTLMDFSEEEVSETTEIFGNIAQRFSRYRKSWIASGKRFEGSGTKSIQFVRTALGWRIASLIWDDD